MVAQAEFLVSHGKSGAFGRFAVEGAFACSRGDRVVIRGPRGLELGTVLCPATDRQQRLLQHVPVGQIVRPARSEDEAWVQRGQALAIELAATARQLVREQALALEVLDAEVLLGGQQAIVQCLAPADSDGSALVEALSAQFQLSVLLENLAVAVPVTSEEEEHGGCGQPGCGRADGGGCSTCGSGGGCSSCGSSKLDLREYFAHLRGKMEERHQRTSLI